MTEEAADVEPTTLVALRLGLAIEEWFATVCRVFDLTPTQAAALRCLQENGPCSQRRLAIYLNCDASYVTAIADRLEHRGAVARRPSTTDRRVRLLGLTPAGADLVAELWQRARQTSPLTTLAAHDRAALSRLATTVLDAIGADTVITKSYD